MIKSHSLVAACLLCACSATPYASVAEDSSSAVRGPDAITVIQRTLTAAGGVLLSQESQDVVATGTVTVSLDADHSTTTPVVISAKGRGRLKLESSLAVGKQILTYSQGSVARRNPDGSTSRLRGDESIKNMSHFFPLTTLAAALEDKTYSTPLTETVLDQSSGRILYHISLQKSRHASEGSPASVSLEYYIDASTLLIARVEHLHLDRGRLPRIPGRSFTDVYSFGDYRMDGGRLLPHQITIAVGERLISTTTVNTYEFDKGLQQAEFIPQ